MNTKSKLLTLTAAAALLPLSIIAKTPTLNLNQPFIIYLQKVTKQDILACRNDDNCMDIMSADQHITVDQMQRLKMLDQRPPYCKTTEEWRNDNYDCIVKNDKLPNIYAKYFHDCYEVETDYVQPTDYCLEVGERLGIVKASNY